MLACRWSGLYSAHSQWCRDTVSMTGRLLSPSEGCFRPTLPVQPAEANIDPPGQQSNDPLPTFRLAAKKVVQDDHRLVASSGSSSLVGRTI